LRAKKLDKLIPHCSNEAQKLEKKMQQVTNKFDASVNPSVKIDLWMHYQDRGIEIRGQMIDTLTWSLGLLIGLLAYIANYFAEHFIEHKDIEWVYIFILSLLGLAFSILLISAFRDFNKHMNENYKLSDTIVSESDLSIFRDGLDKIREANGFAPLFHKEPENIFEKITRITEMLRVFLWTSICIYFLLMVYAALAISCIKPWAIPG
jgi:hypothetical protein